LGANTGGRNVVARLKLLTRPLRCRSLRPQPRATRSIWISCRSANPQGLQSLSVGSKSQVIGANEQVPKPVRSRPDPYMRFARSAALIPLAAQFADHGTRIWSANNMSRDGEAQRYVGCDSAYEAHVRAHRAHPSSTPLLDVIMTRWLRLIQIACNPYRPELHYMRGPGPKWYAKHQDKYPTRGIVNLYTCAQRERT
jgi:hypothetical protein